jgi:hypothetical protein
MPLLDCAGGLPASARERLKQSWAELFRREAMRELLAVEDRFACLYAEEGRPNWSVARYLGISLLQQLQDLDDQAALDALSFDVRWQYALGLSAEEAYLTRRSLVDFRSRLVKKDPKGELLRAVFDRVCTTAIVQLKLSTSEQRLDSTLVCSNIRSRGRLSLGRETLRVFVRSLEEGQRARLPTEVAAWYEADEGGWEQPVGKPELAASLRQLGGWMAHLIELYAGDKEVTEGEPYQLLVRMVGEHGEELGQVQGTAPPDPQDRGEQGGGGASASAAGPPPPQPASAKGPSEDSASPRAAGNKGAGQGGGKGPEQDKPKGKARYWSPHDPDASFGHKGLGYHVQITETCRNEPTELLTDYDVLTAAESDVGQASPVLERLRARERAPQVLYADGGYPSPQGLLEVRASGTELWAPVHRGKLSKETYTRSDFERDEQGQVVRCPQGHAPTRHGERESSDTHQPRRSLHVFFEATTCRACPQLERCPVRTPNHPGAREYRLDFADELVARDERFREQQTEPWRQRYRVRAGVEATMSELKRAHGMARLRVRRLARVLLQVAFKATACNIKRWLRAVRALLLGPLGVSRMLAWLLSMLAAAFLLPSRSATRRLACATPSR